MSATNGNEKNPVEIIFQDSTNKMQTDSCTVAAYSLSSDMLFEFNKSVLANNGALLSVKFNNLNKSEIQKIEITGHTDYIGNTEYNKNLSLERAEAVKTFFVGQGIEEEKITTHGEGSDKPIMGKQHCDKETRQENIDCLQPDRRVDIKITTQASTPR
jgi:OOP family OmpA-OmpF porin